MPRPTPIRNRERDLATLFHLTLTLRGGAQLGKAVKGRSKDGKGKKDGGREATDEEKRLQDSIRRMEMNDYMKKLTVSKKALLKEFMDKEEKISHMNKLKIQNHWRKIMRLVKVEALRKEVEIRSQNHERDVDRKDAIIQMLDRDLEEAEEQFQMALRSHLLNVDQLIDLQDERLLVLEKEFEHDLRHLEQEFTVEKDKIVVQHSMEKNELLRIMHAVEQQEKEREAEARQEHEQLREEIRNKNLEDINVLRITLDSNIEELEQHFETAHLNYLQNTDQRTQDFKYLTAKDQDLSRDIELKIRKIERLQSSIAHWRTKITQNVKECTERNRALEEEKSAISRHFQKLKAKMNRMRDEQKHHLTDLSNNARNAKKTLDEQLELAERIINLGELVRKLETERERVLPFYHSTIADKKEANELTENVRLVVRGEQTHGDDDDALQEFQPQGLNNGIVVSEWEYLDLFWKRYNKVQLDDLAIQREKARYENENCELQAILKQYLDGISVNDTVMNSSNPLLVVNGRLRLHQTTESDPQRKKPIIDANHMVATNRVSK
uniref:Dynein regulatory complex subunit 2 n=1 Tax=Globisporangium ultimum (strain ATCC 200006 / CBS 805.95 / DAOM BR144) TaxID=431595 RepID=K3X0D8_GLOUD